MATGLNIVGGCEGMDLDVQVEASDVVGVIEGSMAITKRIENTSLNTKSEKG